MCKQISALLLLTVFAFPFCGGQGKASPGKTETNTINDGQPKLINPEGKTPFPYRHSIDKAMTDRSGNIWLGTSDGIYRYDGNLFTNYRTMYGLNLDHVSKIMEDKAGNIWFGALCGIICYDLSRSLSSGVPSFGSVKIRADNGLNFLTDIRDSIDAPEAKSPVSQIMEDRNGAIWFAAGYNVYRSDGRSDAAITTSVGSFLKSEKMQYHCKYPDDFGICGIYQDRQGNILISTMACSCGSNVTYRLEAGRANHPCIINKCKHDLHNPMDYAAHYKELNASFTKITNEDGKVNIAFSTVMEDKVGNVWIGSDSGVYRYDGGRLIHFSKNDLLSKSVISTIYEDKKGNIWFGTGESANFQGNGLFRFDPSTKDGRGTPSVKQFSTKDGVCNNGPFNNNIIGSIAEDDAGKLWVSGDGGASWFDGNGFHSLTSNEGFTKQPVKCMMKDKAGNMWFGTLQLGLFRYTGQSITCLTEPKPDM